MGTGTRDAFFGVAGGYATDLRKANTVVSEFCMRAPRPPNSGCWSLASLFLVLGQTHGGAGSWAKFAGRPIRALASGALPALLVFQTTREEIYNILWVLVFGFATLNILSLGARRFEQEKSGLSFGETLAVLVVLVSIVLLGWEMLYVFHILPIRLTPR